MSLDDFAEFLKQGIEECRRNPFRAVPFYEPYTDTVIFYARDERNYHKCITKHLGLFLATGDDSYVGCKIHNVHELMNWDLSLPHDASLMVLADVARESEAYDEEDRLIADRLWSDVRNSVADVQFAVSSRVASER